MKWSTKAGCNSGPCHGSLAGKNGFRLTLRGYDPAADYLALTRQASGRRIVKTEPAKSLLLLKPTLAVPHGGGRRLAPGSPDYQVIVDWIAGGAPALSDADPVIQQLEIQPQHFTARPGEREQLRVVATFSDGHSEDVTRWAKYSSSAEDVAVVSEENGQVEVKGPGEAAITAGHLSKVAFTRVTVPTSNRVDAGLFTQAIRRNFIDDEILQKLAVMRIPPSGPAEDGEFLRRAYLDAAGILPTAEETRNFLADQDPDKRARIIDQLLARPEFVDYWTYKWADLLRIDRGALTLKGMWAFYDWLRAGVESNKPWNQLVREILTASGNSYESGPVNFYRVNQTPQDLVETTLAAFLGIRITCARCHNHPLDQWTQNDYYGVANFFGRVSYKDGEEPGDLTVFSSARGDVSHPRLGRPLPPQTLGGKPLPLEAAEDRRKALAEWVTSPDNPYFARTFVNRVWANFMGTGLVEPVDDLRLTNPASNEELFSKLVADFIQHNYDLRHLVRTIMNSAAYQRASRPLPENAADKRFYSHYVLKRLPPEAILDAMSRVTAVPERFSGVPAGSRAMQLPDTKVPSYFLDIFGRPKRAVTGEERSHDATITQALHVINGSTVNRMLSAAGGIVDSLIRAGLPPDMTLDHLYLSAVARYPTETEKKSLLGMLELGDFTSETAQIAALNRRREVLEDIVWSLLSGKEFLFNH
jgi:hypothetical protein